MEVSTSTCKCLIAVFLAMILSQVAVAVEQFNLLPCTEGGSGDMLYCIEHDSVGDISYLHDNITRRITVKLPLLVLTELWHNQGGIVMVTLSGDVINNGQKLIRSEDKDRWTITFNFQYVDSDVGKLHLVLHIKDLEYRDEQYLHVEIRTADSIFVTRSKIWFPVDVRPTDSSRSNDHRGEAEDPSANLHARIETLQKEKEDLQEEKETLIHYQTKYYHCLEAKDDFNGTMKPEVDVEGKGQGQLPVHANITTLGFAILLVFSAITLLAWTLFLLKDFKLKTTHWDGTESDHRKLLQPNNAITFKDHIIIGQDLLLIQKE